MRGLRECGHVASTISPRQPGAIALVTHRKRSVVPLTRITTDRGRSLRRQGDVYELPASRNATRSKQGNWIRFAKKASRFSSLLLWRLSKAYTGSATVLVDELYTSAFEGCSYIV